MRMIPIALAVLAATTVTQATHADDAQENRSAELQVLDRLFIGTWESVVTNNTTGEKSNTVEKRRWSKAGSFILSEDMNLSTKQEAHFLITYDPNGKKYRSCYIDQNGAAIINGTWDEDTDTMEWSGIDFAGNKSAGKTRLIDKDHIEWSLVITNPDGKVLVELSTKQQRSKK